MKPMSQNSNADLKLSWSKRFSLTTRILAVNIFALALMVFGLFALDSFRTGLFEERLKTSRIKMDAIAEIITETPVDKRADYLVRIGEKNDSRIRLYDDKGEKVIDNFLISEPTYTLRDPDDEPIEKIAARYLDYVFNFLVLEPNLQSFEEPEDDRLSAWEHAEKVAANNPYSEVRNARDLSPVIITIAKTMDGDFTLIETINAHDLRIKIRAERGRIFIFFLIVLTISILLSLFLARTIVRPIRRLATSAVKVRLGRTAHVTIPRLPERSDEIGMLARALSDMSMTLRKRVELTQSFADDVAHEIKNPLASLRSALDGLENIKDPALSKQLLDVAKDDVRRMDRLITDIAEAGRVDSQIAMAQFEEINVITLIEDILKNRKQRDDGKIIIFEYDNNISISIMAEKIRIERVIENLIDNALSFSPPNKPIEINASADHGVIMISVCDNGPGIKESDYEKIFQRFYSSRPEEDFGKHSGLGLAISRTIIEAHNGNIRAMQRPDKKSGACFEIILPAAESHE